MRKTMLLTDGRYELTDGDDIVVVEADDLEVTAATFFPPLPEPVPHEVSARQGKLALLGAGLFGAVEQTIAGLPSPQKEIATIEWNSAAVFIRGSVWINTLGAALGLADEQIDHLFVEAARL